MAPQYVDIDLLIIEKTKPVSRRSENLAAEILTKYDLYERETLLSAPYTARRAAEARNAPNRPKCVSRKKLKSARRKSVQALLACFMEGGLDWMKSSWTVFQEGLLPKDSVPDGPFWDGFLGTFDANRGSPLHRAAEHLLRELGPGDTRDINTSRCWRLSPTYAPSSSSAKPPPPYYVRAQHRPTSPPESGFRWILRYTSVAVAALNDIGRLCSGVLLFSYFVCAEESSYCLFTRSRKLRFCSAT